MYRILTQVVNTNVHCVKCFIRKMFCIISIFIVFITFAEFPSNKKASTMDYFIKTVFFTKNNFSNYSSTKHLEVMKPQYFVTSKQNILGMNLMAPVHLTGNETNDFRFHQRVWIRYEMMQTVKMSPIPTLPPVPYPLRTFVVCCFKLKHVLN